jgi:hypothetical protein
MTSRVSSSQIQGFVSHPRFAGYLAAAESGEHAVELYRWNTLLSGAFYELLQHTEVVMRNAMDREMRFYAAAQGIEGSWLDAQSLLTPRMIERVQKARGYRLYAKKSVGHDDMISEMGYGFWSQLLAKSQVHSLWVPALHAAFPNLVGDPKQVRNAVQRTFILRNRIAHHEPIHQRNLMGDRKDCLEIIGWVDSDAQSWVKGESRVLDVIRSEPVV